MFKWRLHVKKILKGWTVAEPFRSHQNSNMLWMDEVQQDHWSTDSPRALLCIFGLCDTVHVTASRSKSRAIWYTGCLKSGKYWFSTGKLSDIRCAQVVLHISSKKPKRESQSSHRHSTTFKAQVTQIDSNRSKDHKHIPRITTHVHTIPHIFQFIPCIFQHSQQLSIALVAMEPIVGLALFNQVFEVVVCALP